jgi:murein DD-endopeptidase MepM/ murein hydrolase activator NlpD
MAVNTRGRQFRARGRQQPTRHDALERALAAQIAVCLLLLIGMFGFKQFGGERYAEFKREYRDMIANESRAVTISKLLDSAGTWLGELTGKVRDFITGEAPQEHAPRMSPQMPGPDAEDEPAEVTEIVPETEATERKPYDYLDTGAGGGEQPPPAGFSGQAAYVPSYMGVKVRPPLAGLITSGFQYRLHPISGKYGFHDGLDISAYKGAPILAAMPGEVTEIGQDGTYGNYITIQHAMNLSTFYGHCSEILVKAGDAVEAGEKIALVGASGLTTGAHLHFSVINDGRFVNPEVVLKDYVRPVEG